MRRILVVDDQSDVRATIAMILRVKGFEAITVESGSAGLHELANSNFDLAIVDVFLQEAMSGVEVITSLRSYVPNLPVIATSGVAPLDFFSQSPDISNITCLSKPIRPNELMEAIEVALHVHSLANDERDAPDDTARDQLFVAAVESSDDAIITKGLDGIITGWNDAAKELFGFTSHEAVGRSIDIIVPMELRAEVRQILDEIKKGERVRHHDTIRMAKDGRRINVSLSISPVKSRSGVIIGAAKVARDSSARMQEQKALHESEQMAQAIIESSLDAFVQLDEKGTILEF